MNDLPYDDSRRNLPAAVLAENLTAIAGLADCRLELAALLVCWCLLILTAALLAGFRSYSLVRKSYCKLLGLFFLYIFSGALPVEYIYSPRKLPAPSIYITNYLLMYD